MASKLNLNIEQGASFSTTLTLTDDNGVTFGLEGYTGQSHMRRSHSSSNFFALDVNVADMTGGIITISKAMFKELLKELSQFYLKRRNNDINKIVKQFYNGENYDASRD